MVQKLYTVQKHVPDRGHADTRTVTIRITNELWDHLNTARHNNRTPRPHDTVGAYIKWLLETQFSRKR